MSTHHDINGLSIALLGARKPTDRAAYEAGETMGELLFYVVLFSVLRHLRLAAGISAVESAPTRRTSTSRG